MRFSIWPLAGQDWTELLATARHAADTGWDGVWIADHFMGGGGAIPEDTPTLEAGSLVAALAAAVPRVRIGTLVYGNTYRHPALVAKMAATVDHVSGGRFTLGLGTGWQENEHAQYGIDLPPPAERVERFEEAIQIVRSLLREPRTQFAGRHYRITDALCEPKPVQENLPILLGGSGDRMLRIAAGHADAWNTWGLPDHIAERSATLTRACEKVGREPGAIARTAQSLVFLLDDVEAADRLVEQLPMPTMAGPPGRLRDVVAGYAEIGLDELIVPDRTLGQGEQRLATMDRFIDEVAADFR